VAILFHYLHMRERTASAGAACDNDYTDRRVDSNIMVVIVIIVCAGKNRETACSVCECGYGVGRAYKVTN
jgi:hypothetical protein